MIKDYLHYNKKYLVVLFLSPGAEEGEDDDLERVMTPAI